MSDDFKTKRAMFENPPEKEPTAKQKANMFEAAARREKSKDALNKFRVNLNKGRKVKPTGDDNPTFTSKKSAFENPNNPSEPQGTSN
jgi:hypothetical protein